jgi:hypothetical protein
MGKWQPFTRRDDGEYGFVSTGWEYIPDEGEDMVKFAEDMKKAGELIRYIHRVNAGLEEDGSTD